jgi:hypothetical protein
MAPLLSSLAGASAKAFGMLAGVLKPIQDLFTRTTVGSLGIATSGQTWNAIRGVWFANGSAAQSDATPSNYALASIPFTPNATMNADTTGGVGLAFWTSDSSNWWGAYPFYSSVTVTSSVCNANFQTLTSTGSFCGSYTTNPGTTTCNANYQSGLPNTSSCCATATPTTTCNAGYQTGLPNTSSCCATATPTTTYSCPGGTYLCDVNNTCNSEPFCTGTDLGPATPSTTYACFTSTTTTYACFTSTTTTPTTYSGFTAFTTTSTTTYTTSIRIISSVSGSVVTDSTTSLTSNTSSFTNVASMQVNTSSNTITAKGYSAAGQVSQLGSTITRNPASPVRGTSVGIIKAPTDANQGSTLDNYSATF